MDMRMLMSMLGGAKGEEDHGNVKVMKTDSDFTKEISAAGEKLVVVDYFAEWCFPCKMVSPIVTELSYKYTNVVFLKVNVDELQSTAAHNNVSAMPTFQFFKRGKRVDELVGADPVRLERLVTEHGGALDAMWEKKKAEKQASRLKETSGGEDHGNVVIAQSREHLRKVLEDAGSKPVVVDFYADWCGPCRMMSPKIEAYSKKYDGSAVFVKVDTDALGEICDQCEVRALPTFCVFKNGKKVDQIVGANPAKLESSFKSHM